VPGTHLPHITRHHDGYENGVCSGIIHDSGPDRIRNEIKLTTPSLEQMIGWETHVNLVSTDLHH